MHTECLFSNSEGRKPRESERNVYSIESGEFGEVLYLQTASKVSVEQATSPSGLVFPIGPHL